VTEHHWRQVNAQAGLMVAKKRMGRFVEAAHPLSREFRFGCGDPRVPYRFNKRFSSCSSMAGAAFFLCITD
jgi:hypothetical protein